MYPGGLNDIWQHRADALNNSAPAPVTVLTYEHAHLTVWIEKANLPWKAGYWVH